MSNTQIHRSGKLGWLPVALAVSTLFLAAGCQTAAPTAPAATAPAATAAATTAPAATATTAPAATATTAPVAPAATAVATTAPAQPTATTAPAAPAATATGVTQASPPTIPHTLEGRSDCLVCHGPGGIKPFPANHAGRTSAVCTGCHRPRS